MILEKGFIYHIYNQGNNHRKIFFSQENYLFFLEKIKTYIRPYADILAWCLMPNHFHLMVLVKKNELSADKSETMIQSYEGLTESGGATQSRTPTRTISFNHSIGILLASYTRAINKQNNTSGSLFRGKTKAECLNFPKGITPSFIAKNRIAQSNPENEYPQICFNYIHQNPVKAQLVKKETEWAFSSAKDYSGLRNGKLINKIVAKDFGLTYNDTPWLNIDKKMRETGES